MPAEEAPRPKALFRRASSGVDGGPFGELTTSPPSSSPLRLRRAPDARLTSSFWFGKELLDVRIYRYAAYRPRLKEPLRGEECWAGGGALDEKLTVEFKLSQCKRGTLERFHLMKWRWPGLGAATFSAALDAGRSRLKRRLKYVFFKERDILPAETLWPGLAYTRFTRNGDDGLACGVGATATAIAKVALVTYVYVQLAFS